MKSTLLKWSFDQVLYTHFLFLYKFVFSGGPNAVPLFFFMLCLPLIGCSPSYYAPGPQCPPGFVKKKESRLALAYIQTQSARGYETCFAHTPLPHLSVMGNHLTYSGEYTSNQTSQFSHGFLNEMGLGYYTALGSRRQLVMDLCYYSAFGNVAFRGSGNQSSSQNFYVESKFRKRSVLAGFTFLSNHLEAALSVKLSQLSYADTRFSRHSPEFLSSSLMDTQKKYLAEPSLVLRAGWPNVKLYFGLELSHSIVPSALAMADKRLSGGLSFKF
ncbi:MAG: hypothetical protein IPH94_03290 [Saprospiraceae bacterium]|nr:hypothetical protein [Saprospiraceae bacterium]